MPLKLLKLDSRQKETLVEWLKWLLFTVGFSLGPLLANWIILHDGFKRDGVFHNLQLVDLFDHGELYLISGAISADAISRQIRKRKEARIRYVVIMAVCVYALFGSTIEYGTSVHHLLLEDKVMPSDQAVRSLAYFVCMILAGTGSVLTSQEEA